MATLLTDEPCEATLVDGRSCSDAARHVVGWFALCNRHHQKLVDEVLAEDRCRHERLLVEGRLAEERLRRLDRVRPSFRKEATGWLFDFTLPAFDGASRRHVRRRGFKRKLDAQREAKAMLEALRGPLTVGVEAYLEAVEQRRREARETWSRLEAQVEAERLAVHGSVAAARRERERQRIVYYVRRPDGAVKIGTTWNLKTRMQAFRNVNQVELLAWHTGGQCAEAALHRRFKHLRLDGEWFEAGQDLVDHIRYVAGCAERRGRAAT